MSHTDKTQPWWWNREWEPVHAVRCPNRPLHLSYHPTPDPNYRCDLPPAPSNHHPDTRRRKSHCHWWPDTPNYYSDAGSRIWGRERHVKHTANLYERGIRAAWRNTAHRLLATGREDLDDIELPDPRHRHFALWDRW